MMRATLPDARVSPIPSRIVPSASGALAFHPIANDRLGICPECQAWPLNPAIVACRRSGCPFLHDEASA